MKIGVFNINKKNIIDYFIWVLFAQIISLFVFFVALRIIYYRDNSGDVHLFYKVFKDLTSHGETFVFYIPASCWLFLEMYEKRKKRDKTFAFFIGLFLLAFLYTSSEYVVVVSGLMDYSFFLHVVFPLVLLNITAILVKSIYNEDKNNKVRSNVSI